MCLRVYVCMCVCAYVCVCDADGVEMNGHHPAEKVNHPIVESIPDADGVAEKVNHPFVEFIPDADGDELNGHHPVAPINSDSPDPILAPCVWHARTLRDLSFRAGVLDDDDDELDGCTARQARNDPLLNRPILVSHEGEFTVCKIVGVELGASSGRRYYRVKYPDGDLRHFNEVEAAIMVEFEKP